MLKKLQIFGERNSGTRYLARLVEKNLQLVVTQDYGFKHWFIPGVVPRSRENLTTDRQAVKSIYENEDTLFLYIVRHPYGWLKAMSMRPYHAPNHENLPFEEFLTRAWESYEINSCNPDVHEKWLQSDGYYFIEEAENICQLRNMKNQHFTSLKGIVQHFHLIRLDSIREDFLQLITRFDLPTAHDEIDFIDYRKPREYFQLSGGEYDVIHRMLDIHMEADLGFQLLI